MVVLYIFPLIPLMAPVETPAATLLSSLSFTATAAGVCAVLFAFVCTCHSCFCFVFLSVYFEAGNVSF
ncbi:hypothetical protein BJ741DRAFT_612561 [Chytriomyces cf. hyalinus JEL632]|nr:hypothetical protein BJ741DRAFT_612561 [Chytriomyces cf. hyalinus JEL632]